MIVRDINFTSFKIGTSLKTYRWKPIIIAVSLTVNNFHFDFSQTALKEFPVVYYIDSSTDMRTNVSMKEFMAAMPMKPDEPNIYAVCVADHSPYVATNPGRQCRVEVILLIRNVRLFSTAVRCERTNDVGSW